MRFHPANHMVEDFKDAGMEVLDLGMREAAATVPQIEEITQHRHVDAVFLLQYGNTSAEIEVRMPGH